MENIKYKRKQTAEFLGIKHRIGRYAVSFWVTEPLSKKLYKLVSFHNLDNVITNPTEILQAIIDDGGSIKYEKEIPGFEGTQKSLDKLTIRKQT